MGLAPVRVDIIAEMNGVDFAEAWTERMTSGLAGVPAGVLSLRHLIQNKKASGRLRDLADVEALEKLRRDVRNGRNSSRAVSHGPGGVGV